MDINSVGNVRFSIDDMLNKIRDINTKSKAFNTNHTDKPVATKENSFSNVLASVGHTVEKVSELQNASEKIGNSYLIGDRGTTLADVVVSTQKSKLAFDGLVTVRNKILEAYRDIMNMPI